MASWHETAWRLRTKLIDRSTDKSLIKFPLAKQNYITILHGHYGARQWPQAVHHIMWCESKDEQVQGGGGGESEPSASVFVCHHPASS